MFIFEWHFLFKFFIEIIEVAFELLMKIDFWKAEGFSYPRWDTGACFRPPAEFGIDLKDLQWAKN